MIKSNEKDIVIALYKSKVPEHMHDSLLRYALYGTRPGSFLRAVLSNNLFESCCCADDINITKLHTFAYFLHNHMHHDMYGSLEKVMKWIEVGGLKGLENAVMEGMEDAMRWKKEKGMEDSMKAREA